MPGRMIEKKSTNPMKNFCGSKFMAQPQSQTRVSPMYQYITFLICRLLIWLMTILSPRRELAIRGTAAPARRSLQRLLVRKPRGPIHVSS
jgi:hypothetical protein